ncbi:hypothetical protein Srufu_045060 [Streptomyces libani subsp. rufus]|nr:hypothetical protein Srufu_045060 [Streptomyces libani subsp. rufus]
MLDTAQTAARTASTNRHFVPRIWRRCPEREAASADRNTAGKSASPSVRPSLTAARPLASRNISPKYEGSLEPIDGAIPAFREGGRAGDETVQ